MRTLNVYTAQMAASKKLSSNQFFKLDVTVKSGDKVFAPTWDMVMGYKNGTVSEAQYTGQYHKMMRFSYENNRPHWEDIINNGANCQGLVLMCYCKKGDFCHRHLLKEYIKKVAEKMGFKVTVHEEV